MKQAVLITLFAVSLMSCDKKYEEQTKPDDEAGMCVYTGLLNVNEGTEMAYKDSGAVIETSINADSTLLTMVLKNVKFAEQMPVLLTITIDSIETEKSAGGLLLTGNNIVPTTMGGAFPQYTITGITGMLTYEKLEFSMMCGQYPLNYTGLLSFRKMAV